MKNKEMNPATSRRTQLVTKLAFSPIYGVLLGVLFLIAAAPVAHAQKVVNPSGTILDLKIKPPLQITAISGNTVTAREPVSGETIQFKRPATQVKYLNVGQNIWLISTKTVGIKDTLKAMGAIFPAEGTERSKVGGGDWMETSIKLSNTGLLTGKTKT